MLLYFFLYIFDIRGPQLLADHSRDADRAGGIAALRDSPAGRRQLSSLAEVFRQV